MMTLEEAYEFGRQGMGIDMFRREVRIRERRALKLAELAAYVEAAQRDAGRIHRDLCCLLCA